MTKTKGALTHANSYNEANPITGKTDDQNDETYIFATLDLDARRGFSTSTNIDQNWG